MKVTVCFGAVRVVVPCGDGDISVQDLIRQATLRYKKATGKTVDSWVAVQSLQTSDGGILDPDDRLQDVVDDREQILATFSDGDGPHHGGGDGASGSSVGTSSPDIFQNEKYGHSPADIEVTSEAVGTNSLQVRRGSEPALNQLEGEGGTLNGAPPTANHTNKRWSAAPIILDADNSPSHVMKAMNGCHDEDWGLKEEEEGRLSLPNGKFQRDGSSRLSMQFLGDGPGMMWVDAKDRMIIPRDRRREPLGQANAAEYGSLPRQNNQHNHIDPENTENFKTELIVLGGREGGPLGIHVVPDYDSLGRDRGLLVQGIEPAGRVARDGRLSVFDRIVEINGSNLLNKPFHRVQEIFKNSLSSSELRLRVIKHFSPASHEEVGVGGAQKPPQPVYPSENHVDNMETHPVGSKVATVSPTKKPPVTAVTKSLLAANTRKIGRRIELDLVKGPAGLGFSITTRDNPAGGNSPIYIKNILNKGAAVDDGRLRPGDRLLSVNGIEMTGKSQPEAVAILRQIASGATAKIIVSRQEESNYQETSPEKPPRAIKQERNVDGSLNNSLNGSLDCAQHSTDPHQRRPSVDNFLASPVQKLELKPQRSLDESQIYPWRHREILTLDIPVHDTEKAGLGVSVKGKTSATHSVASLNNSQQSVDLGIFVKSVIHGGAASRDGRLRTNDQLLSVNGKSLLNQSNANAMETLRRAMLYGEGPRPGVISLTVARRANVPTSALDTSRGSASDVTPDNSITSETSETTVIFLPHNDSADSSTHELRHPVIDRLTGQHGVVHGAGLRNESYYRATHELTWNTSNMAPSVKNGRLQSPTVNPVLAEPVLIEEDYPTTPQVYRPSLQTQRSDGSISGSGSISTHGDITYASQQSLEEPPGFARDAVGRQSMSEKRHATLDAKNTDTYRRSKKMREERQDGTTSGGEDPVSGRIAEIRQELLQPGRALVRVGSAESIAAAAVTAEDGGEVRGRADVGPSLGMRKSSSLESLQTMVQEIQMAEDGDPAYSYRTPQGVRVVRGRGCNDSFRAAVDRSYDAPLGIHHAMETLSEEEAALGNGSADDPPCLLGRGTPRQSSMNAAHDPKHKLKKKPGLLKGIGSMFRFGKHRKPMEPGLEAELQEAERERNEARLAAQAEHQKIQEQYRRLQLQQQQQQQQQQQPNKRQIQQAQMQSPVEHDSSPGTVEGQHARKLSLDDGSESGSSRSQRIHQLRQQHQRKHAERQGHYPLEEQQEHYERMLRQRLEHTRSQQQQLYGEAVRRNQQQQHQQNNHNDVERGGRQDHQHGNLNNKVHTDMGRPGSRSGITDPARFSHYVNLEEIQQHLNRGKQHYHSQRRDPREPTPQRPVSNFYEYETVQSVMADVRHDSLPRRHSKQYQDPLAARLEETRRNMGKSEFQDLLARRIEEDARLDSLKRRGNHDTKTIINMDEDSRNNNPNRVQKDSLPRRLEEEFQRQARGGTSWVGQEGVARAGMGQPQDSSRPTVRSTVNYLNQLSRGDPRNVRARGPFISQVTIRENPDES